MVSFLNNATKLVLNRLGADGCQIDGAAEFNSHDRSIGADRIRRLVD